MRPQYLIILLSVLLFASLSAFSAAPPSRSGEGPCLGCWNPIKNVSDPHVEAVANFAVNEHDREPVANLTLVKVLSGRYQVVQGCNYDLVLSAMQGSATANNYEALVLEKVGRNSSSLISFAPLLQ